jgi:Legume-like lectin family
LDGKLCFETNQVLLPPGNYFGISASTGDVPDHHQLFGFKVTPLEVESGSQNEEFIPDNPAVQATIQSMAAVIPADVLCDV